MKILSVDTSSMVCSVCILENNQVIYHKSIENGLTHSEKLLPMIKEAFDQTFLTLSDIDLYACCIGPGSFTGIRIGISTLKAFLDVYDKPSIGISSLESLAFPIQTSAPICSLLDAKNRNVYYSLFQQQEQIAEDQFGSIEDILNRIQTNPNLPITFVGDGAILYQKEIAEVFPHATFEERKASAISIGQAAYYHYQKGTTSSLTPLYLRKSQAERMLEDEK